MESAYHRARLPPRRMPPPTHDAYGYASARRRPALDRVDVDMGMQRGPSSAPVRPDLGDLEIVYARDRSGRLIELDARDLVAARRDRQLEHEREYMYEEQRRDDYDPRRNVYDDHRRDDYDARRTAYEDPRRTVYDDPRRDEYDMRRNDERRGLYRREDVYHGEELVYEEPPAPREREAYAPADYVRRARGAPHMRSRVAHEYSLDYRPQTRDVPESHLPHPRYAPRDDRDYDPGPRGYAASERGHPPAPRHRASYDDDPSISDRAGVVSLAEHELETYSQETYVPHGRVPRGHAPRDVDPVDSPSVVSATTASSSARERSEQALRQRDAYKRVSPAVSSTASDPREAPLQPQAHASTSSLPTRIADSASPAAPGVGIPFDGRDNGAFEAPRRAPEPADSAKSPTEQKASAPAPIETRHKVSGVLKPTPDLVAHQPPPTAGSSKSAESTYTANGGGPEKAEDKMLQRAKEADEERAGTPTPHDIAAEIERNPALFMSDSDLYFSMGMGAAGVGFSPLTFRSKPKAKKSEKSEGKKPEKPETKKHAENGLSSTSKPDVKGKMRAAGASEPELKAKEEHTKSNKMGLFGRKKKAKEEHQA
ncbi:hypothetical protein FA95DRAFT_1554818 [Auriscalpium vulgare]|uniref:Uncharacterized protein n=1 Tax=Auriscalpium vulgare TaxID=40419 RepID=A0ACB8S647_9AGAM|nr:hypothetical protein FA95DRAFT_1554818 [Auriscalpium vulgare]